MGLSSKIKEYIASYIRVVVRHQLHLIEKGKEQNRVDELLSNATYNRELVRIDQEATITNNRKDKSLITIGDNSWIKGQLMTLKHGGSISIGKDCFIGENSRIWSSVKITIGNRVLISHNVNVHDNISHSLESKERHEDFLHVRHIGLQEHMIIPEKEIVIGDDVWIGFNSTILKGVTIGQGAIIGANTVITKDVPPLAVVVGNPARIIKYTT